MAHILTVRNLAGSSLRVAGIGRWRGAHPNELAVYTVLSDLPDGALTNARSLMDKSRINKTAMKSALPWLEAAGFIKREYDEITVLSVPEFRLIPDISQQFRSVHHIEKKPLPASDAELFDLRHRFGVGTVGEAAFQLYLDAHDKDSVDVPMLGIDKYKLRGMLCELQASGLVNTFARQDQFIYVPWDLPKEEAQEAVDIWLKSPDAEPAAHLEPKSTDPYWKRFLDAYKSLAKHFTGTSVVIRKEDIPLAKKLVREHDEFRLKLYHIAASFFLYYTDFEEDFEWDIKKFGYSFRTFYKHFEAIAAEYVVKQNRVFGGKEYWVYGELKDEGYDYKTEWEGW